MDNKNKENQEVSTATAASAETSATSETGAADGGSADDVSASRIETDVIEVLKTVYDPEIPVDIYDLGLIYSVKVDPRGEVDVQMTLTSPACPVAGSLPGEVEMKVRSVAGVTAARIELVWDPPWDKDMMSEAAQLKLGFF